MPDFAWRAIDVEGREKRGRISAANDQIVHERLVRQRLHVVAIEPAPPKQRLQPAYQNSSSALASLV